VLIPTADSNKFFDNIKFSLIYFFRCARIFQLLGGGESSYIKLFSKVSILHIWHLQTNPKAGAKIFPKPKNVEYILVIFFEGCDFLGLVTQKT
jgi:hypothetical protein